MNFRQMFDKTLLRFIGDTVCCCVTLCTSCVICIVCIFCSHATEVEQLRQLEEEQEQLNSSLLALTTHFAQVQFRLKQIVSADQDDKEVHFCYMVICLYAKT